MKKLLVAAVVVIILAIAGLGVYGSVRTTEHTGCEVTDKDRTTNSEGKSDMRVYTTCGTFEVSDSLFIGRWDSADVYADIVVGETYDFTVRGYRIPIASTFPNIDTYELTS